MSKYFWASAATALVLCLGGAACIVWSVNVKIHDRVLYDVSTTGVATKIAPLSLAFEYAYFFSTEAVRVGTWLPTRPFTNASLVVTYASARPDCSLVSNVPGQAANLGFCGPMTSSPWFWPLLMTVGIATMSAGSLAGFAVARVCLGVGVCVCKDGVDGQMRVPC